jgi:hypothetical protein
MVMLTQFWGDLYSTYRLTYRALIFRYSNYLIAFLFGLSAVAQINDPDPLFWVMIYGAGSLVSILYAFNRLWWVFGLAVSLIAGIWALTIVPDLTLSGFQNIMEEIGMSYVGVEAAREFSGLMVIGIWCGILAKKSRRSADRL